MSITSKHKKGFKKPYFGMFKRAFVVNMKIVAKLLNSKDSRMDKFKNSLPTQFVICDRKHVYRLSHRDDSINLKGLKFATG